MSLHHAVQRGHVVVVGVLRGPLLWSHQEVNVVTSGSNTSMSTDGWKLMSNFNDH